MSLLKVTIYSKAECCLCDEAKAVLARVRAQVPFDLEEIDIATSSELGARYGTEIPVVFVGGRKAFKYHVDETALRRKLMEPSR